MLHYARHNDGSGYIGDRQKHKAEVAQLEKSLFKKSAVKIQNRTENDNPKHIHLKSIGLKLKL